MAIPAALAHPTAEAQVRPGAGFGCGTRDPTPDQIQATQEIAVQEAAGNFSIVARQTVNVDVYFHVVASSTALSGGYLTTTMLNNQFSVLQNTFAAHGFTFTLKGTDFTINTSWADDGAELTMKKALRKGDYKALNIYFHRNLGGNFGYCYFPASVSSGSNDFYRDGCSILYTTVPGGSATNYNLGYTVTHEVGHWFGLYHTFQGSSCTGSGDLVSDTPAQLSATSGCPVGRDSCPSQAGLDPIRNFMDYSYDTCYEEFTAGQKTRMHSMWNQYRA
ncbi:hypothetical protein B0T16DRAFT_323393 [Cercophora newfieldiana]|uniref:Peptidase M43 pregnancy-associated plasma-A domain-containing protein n=1 Tax=Cercophora newfieldiana TaxID=92897 RepID=A0AA39YK65_9PEZI|nr:hypothetical protein B0T16DRAFT_323393 [Cercophora newfieldiana]